MKSRVQVSRDRRAPAGPEERHGALLQGAEPNLGYARIMIAMHEPDKAETLVQCANRMKEHLKVKEMYREMRLQPGKPDSQDPDVPK